MVDMAKWLAPYAYCSLKFSTRSTFIPQRIGHTMAPSHFPKGIREETSQTSSRPSSVAGCSGYDRRALSTIVGRDMTMFSVFQL